MYVLDNGPRIEIFQTEMREENIPFYMDDLYSNELINAMTGCRMQKFFVFLISTIHLI
jgi:hypothetical protein